MCDCRGVDGDLPKGWVMLFQEPAGGSAPAGLPWCTLETCSYFSALVPAILHPRGCFVFPLLLLLLLMLLLLLLLFRGSRLERKRL